jgi:hypothetical protein
LTVIGVATWPASGTLTLDATGAFNYTPVKCALVLLWLFVACVVGRRGRGVGGPLISSDWNLTFLTNAPSSPSRAPF